MKKLIFVVMTLLLSSIGVMSPQNTDSVEVSDQSILRMILPDSIYSSIEGSRILFYTIGHHGYSWSLITMKDSAFLGYRGKELMTHTEMEPIDFAQLDSTAFFSANRNLFLWGLDTIAVESRKMKPVERKLYFISYKSLSVMEPGQEPEDLFDASNIDFFSGQDSVAFNQKYHRLSFIMRWLADPDLRPYIPESLIY